MIINRKKCTCCSSFKSQHTQQEIAIIKIITFFFLSDLLKLRSTGATNENVAHDTFLGTQATKTVSPHSPGVLQTIGG